jgi:hypothetical protein
MKLPVLKDPRLKLISVATHALESGSVVFVCSTVCAVLRLGSWSQVLNPVVEFISIDVIQVLRKIPVVVEVDESVSFISFTINPNLSVATMTYSPSFHPNPNPLPPHPPVKFSVLITK